MEFMFEGNQTVSSDKFATTVPADFHGLYAEKDGNYVLRSDDPVVASTVKVTTGLSRALKAARAEAQAFKAKAPDLSKLAEFGSDADSILAGFQSKIDEVKATHSTKTGQELERQVTKIKEDLSSAHRGEIDKRDVRITALTGQLHSLMVTATATSALAEANVIDAELVLPFINSQVKVSEEDGKFVVSVVDKAGDPRYSGTTGAPMTIRELVTEMKSAEKFGPLFKSDSHSGGGTQHTTQHKGGAGQPVVRSGTGKITHALDGRSRKTA